MSRVDAAKTIASPANSCRFSARNFSPRSDLPVVPMLPTKTAKKQPGMANPFCLRGSRTQSATLVGGGTVDVDAIEGTVAVVGVVVVAVVGVVVVVVLLLLLLAVAGVVVLLLLAVVVVTSVSVSCRSVPVAAGGGQVVVAQGVGCAGRDGGVRCVMKSRRCGHLFVSLNCW